MGTTELGHDEIRRSLAEDLDAVTDTLLVLRDGHYPLTAGVVSSALESLVQAQERFMWEVNHRREQ